MMSDDFSGLASRIREELNELERVLTRIGEGWERIFTLIAETIDRKLPQGENWHTLLLGQMTREIPRLRPAVISSKVGERLNEFRGFRHVVRNVYTYRFDLEKAPKLVLTAPGLFAQVKKELLAFANFLEGA